MRTVTLQTRAGLSASVTGDAALKRLRSLGSFCYLSKHYLLSGGEKKKTIARISAKILLKSLCSSEKRSVELSHRTTLDNPETSALNAAVWSSFKTDKK